MPPRGIMYWSLEYPCQRVLVMLCECHEFLLIYLKRDQSVHACLLLCCGMCCVLPVSHCVVMATLLLSLTNHISSCYGTVGVTDHSYSCYHGNVSVNDQSYSCCHGNVSVTDQSYSCCHGNVSVIDQSYLCCHGNVSVIDQSYSCCHGNVSCSSPWNHTSVDHP